MYLELQNLKRLHCLHPQPDDLNLFWFACVELLEAGCRWLWNSVTGLILVELYSGNQRIKSYKKPGNVYSSTVSKTNSTHWRCDKSSFVEHVEVTFDNKMTWVVHPKIILSKLNIILLLTLMFTVHIRGGLLASSIGVSPRKKEFGVGGSVGDVQ